MVQNFTSKGHTIKRFLGNFSARLTKVNSGRWERICSFRGPVWLKKSRCRLVTGRKGRRPLRLSLAPEIIKLNN